METRPRAKSQFLILSGILSVGALLLALYVFSIIRSAHASQPQLPQRSLGLRAERRGNALRVTWDPRSPALQGVPEANLSVDDGPLTSQFRLTQSQIREGGIHYTPQTDSVVFHLTARDQNDKSSVESLQVLQAKGPSAPPPDDVPEPAPTPIVAAPKTGTGTADRRIAAPSTAANVPGTVVVHGYMERGTSVDVRIPVDSQGRPMEQIASDPPHKRGGILHHLSKLGKASARLWPFHHREETDSSR